MITFTDTDKDLRDTLSEMGMDEAKNYLRAGGWNSNSGCYKLTFFREDKKFVIKLLRVRVPMRKTPYQTVRAIDGFDLSVELEDRYYHQRGRVAFREVYGNRILKEFRAKQYYTGQGRDFIFVIQEKVRPVENSPEEETRYEEVSALRQKMSPLIERLKRTFPNYHADHHIGNWGINEKGDLVVYDGC